MTRVLVLDQASSAAEQVRHALRADDVQVTPCRDVEGAAAALKRHPALFFVNLCIQPEVDFGAIEAIVRKAAGVPLVLLAGCGPLEAAAHVLFPHAAAVLRTPLSEDAIRREVLGALEARTGNGHGPPSHEGLGGIVGAAQGMQDVYRGVERAATSDSTVLITGETGTGKELVARTIHELSPRKQGPFVIVSCAELVDSLVESELFGHARGSFTGASRSRLGLFEAANGGTVLLDEVSDASPAVQARLLRVVEERQVRRLGEVRSRDVDVRLIAASQEPLEQRADAGTFRKDLLYRLRVLRISLPPLRQRREDIPALVSHYLSRLEERNGVSTGCSPLALEVLRAYEWPGNVRELFSVLEAAELARRGDRVAVVDLPDEVVAFWAEGNGGSSEATRIVKALGESGGRRNEAAEILGMSRTTLWRRMKDLGL